MALLVNDCSRCGVRRITFDLRGESNFGYRRWEAFCVCRSCGQATIFKLRGEGKPSDFETIHDHMNIGGRVTVADHNVRPSPDNLSDAIAAAFNEGAKCLTIGCHNAAATMFRLAVDIATEDLLPSDKAEPPDERTRRILGPRLEWLFENKKLPEVLKDLASVVKDDGNDGAHRGTVDKETAEDLVDFTERLLTLMYTEPARIEAAKKRSAERRNPETQ